jgi:hypothetical protein
VREGVCRVLVEDPGHLEAQAETLPIRIAAPTVEALQHEARESLIHYLMPEPTAPTPGPEPLALLVLP